MKGPHAAGTARPAMPAGRRAALIQSIASDYSFIIMIFLIVLMMIMPIPLWATDALVFFSITISIVTLMMSMYVREPVAFSSYPVILLTLAIFRISLSVSTTRNILVFGDTGDIVTAFGEFAIAGNIVVGVVIFTLITIVQFIVINKGSERVAEVSARFSLDSMPGKQMSIDADLRAGSISAAEAKTMRAKLSAESQFHGAMDGSMKFLTGDAIAGVLMVVINMLGGLMVGMGQLGMPFGEAIHRYTVLTIGDALVAQIPAIFTAISSGILVTRVDDPSAEHGSVSDSVAENIINQFLAHPKALLAGAVVTAGIAFFPGFPTLLCLAFAVSLLAGYLLIRRGARRRAAAERWTTVPLDELSIEPGASLCLSSSLASSISIPDLEDAINRGVSELGQRMNLPYPPVSCIVSPELQEGQYLIFFRGFPFSGGYHDPGRCIAMNCGRVLDIALVEHQRLPVAEDSTRYYSIAAADAPAVARFEARVMSAEEFIRHRVQLCLLRNSSALITLEFVRVFMERNAKEHPDAVRELAKAIPPLRLVEVFRQLVSENLSLREQQVIVERALEVVGREKDVPSLVRELRRHLTNTITMQALCRDGRLYAMQLTPQTQQRLIEAVRQSQHGEFLSLDMPDARRLEAQIEAALVEWELEVGKLVLIAPLPARQALRRLLQNAFPFLTVLALEEIRPDVRIELFAVIAIEELPMTSGTDQPLLMD